MFSSEFILKFLKFGVVGGIGFVIDFSLTYLFKEKLKVHKYIANGVGFFVAATCNYVLNRIWTFHSNDPEVALQFVIFLVVSIIGFGINTLFLYLFEIKFKLNFYVAKLLAIGVTMFWNFAINYLYTFH
ncbi:MAG: GtrA family protein [Bacteroidales bacterium]|nr:GtrA family protein [Bacteroidales bacterium]